MYEKASQKFSINKYFSLKNKTNIAIINEVRTRITWNQKVKFNEWPFSNPEKRS